MSGSYTDNDEAYDGAIEQELADRPDTAKDELTNVCDKLRASRRGLAKRTLKLIQDLAARIMYLENELLRAYAEEPKTRGTERHND